MPAPERCVADMAGCHIPVIIGYAQCLIDRFRLDHASPAGKTESPEWTEKWTFAELLELTQTGL